MSDILLDNKWFEVRDGDDRLHSIFERHYSSRPHRLLRRYWPNWKRICPPGEHMILLTKNCDALFVWVREQIRDDGQTGINCSIFRNEGPILSSRLILEAENLALDRWVDKRLFTYINPLMIKSSNPGYCFLQAGWRRCGISRKGLIILEKCFE